MNWVGPLLSTVMLIGVAALVVLALLGALLFAVARAIEPHRERMLRDLADRDR